MGARNASTVSVALTHQLSGESSGVLPFVTLICILISYILACVYGALFIRSMPCRFPRLLLRGRRHGYTTLRLRIACGSAVVNMAVVIADRWSRLAIARTRSSKLLGPKSDIRSRSTPLLTVATREVHAPHA